MLPNPVCHVVHDACPGLQRKGERIMGGDAHRHGPCCVATNIQDIIFLELHTVEQPAVSAHDSCGVRTHALTEWRLEPPP